MCCEAALLKLLSGLKNHSIRLRWRSRPGSTQRGSFRSRWFRVRPPGAVICVVNPRRVRPRVSSADLSRRLLVGGALTWVAMTRALAQRLKQF